MKPGSHVFWGVVVFFGWKLEGCFGCGRGEGGVWILGVVECGRLGWQGWGGSD